MKEEKKLAAEKAVEQIESGMIIGLGTGSTLNYALKHLAGKIGSGELENIKGIPTSQKTEDDALKLGITLTDLSDHPEIDLTIDGADEVDEDLNLIKGGGGALLREKVVAQASRKVVIVVDESKLSKKLGEKFFVPVEILKFAYGSEKKFLESLGADVKRREGKTGEVLITDEDNIILDCNFGVIEDPEALSRKLNERAGIIEHGIFLALADEVIAGTSDGIKFLKKKIV